MSDLRPGDPAPAFDLPGSGGARLRLADFAGRALVLFIYPKDDTSGCTQEAKDFTALMPDFQAAGAAVVGLSKDSAKSHDRYIAKHALETPLASDEDTATLQAYGAWVEKSLYGRKYMGADRSTFLIGADGRIARIWRKVKIPGHAAEVLEAVKAL